MPNPNLDIESAAAPTAPLHGPTAHSAALQAVVVIHGMGEQRPMDTIKSFVEAVWKTDIVITANGLPRPNQVWSKPDERTGSLELRRITTRESIASPQFPGGVRTDFYELYWADLTAGSTWDAVTGWVRGLLLRSPKGVSSDVRLAWVFLWIAALVVLGITLVSLVPAEWWKSTRVPWLSDWHWLSLAIAAGLGTVLHKVAAAYFGRVVRYTRADPDNIAARAAVRERGLKLLRALHEGGYYKRMHIEKLKAQLAQLKRAHFGRSSEKLDAQVEQMELLIGEMEESRASAAAQREVKAAAVPARRERVHPVRQTLPAHLPRERVEHDAACICPRCGSERLTKIGTDEREVLEYVPSHFKVIVHARPKIACRERLGVKLVVARLDLALQRQIFSLERCGEGHEARKIRSNRRKIIRHDIV